MFTHAGFPGRFFGPWPCMPAPVCRRENHSGPDQAQVDLCVFVWTCVRGWMRGGEIHVLLAWTRMLYVLACWRAGVLACLRAVPTPTPRAPTTATSLGHKTIHGTNMLIGRTCDGAEQASLLKLPPWIHRLMLRRCSRAGVA